jgi:hypothetical protein
MSSNGKPCFINKLESEKNSLSTDNTTNVLE